MPEGGGGWEGQCVLSTTITKPSATTVDVQHKGPFQKHPPTTTARLPPSHFFHFYFFSFLLEIAENITRVTPPPSGSNPDILLYNSYYYSFAFFWMYTFPCLFYFFLFKNIPLPTYLHSQLHSDDVDDCWHIPAFQRRSPSPAINFCINSNKMTAGAEMEVDGNLVFSSLSLFCLFHMPRWGNYVAQHPVDTDRMYRQSKAHYTSIYVRPNIPFVLRADERWNVWTRYKFSLITRREKFWLAPRAHVDATSPFVLII